MAPTATDETTMSASEWGLLLLLSGLWGCTFLFVGIAVKEIPPLTLVMCRVGLAAVILHGLVRWRGVALPRNWRDWQPFFVLAIFNNIIPFTLIAWGQQFIPSGLASILNAATPLFVLLVARAVVGEAIVGNKLVGVAVGILGVAVLVGPDVSAVGLGQSTLGMLACLGGALSYGCAAYWSRRVRGEPPLKTATAQLTVSTVIMGVMAASVDQFWTLPTPSSAAITAIVGAATISTALAYLVFFRLIVSAGPQNANLVTLLIPPSAILLGVLVLNERLLWQHGLGAVIIGVGLVAIDGRAYARWRQSRRPH